MAIWQYDFFLVPHQGIIRHHGIVPTVLPDFAPLPDDLDADLDVPSLNYWSGTGIPGDIVFHIDLLLPRIESWSRDARMFGSEDGNKIELWNDSIFCRFDMRHPSLDFLEAILDLAQQMNCYVVPTDSGEVLEAQVSSVVLDMQNSNACRFVENPVEFLRKRLDETP